MPIKLKNRVSLPKADAETIEVLGLDIPLTGDLPFGGQIELFDLQTAYDEGAVGKLEFLMRVFCIFTWRLAKHEHVKYDWLSRQKLESEELAELTTGTLKLLEAMRADGDEGNDPKPSKRAKSKS